MEIQKDIFCSNHSKKHAKKHCNQCNLDLCNECALDQHISHYKSLQKIDYSSKKKILNYSDMLCEEIRKILNNSFDDMTIKVYKNVQEKALNYMKSHPKNEPKKINIAKNEINKENVINAHKNNKVQTKVQEEKSENKEKISGQIIKQQQQEKQLIIANDIEKPKINKIELKMDNTKQKQFNELIAIFDGNKKEEKQKQASKVVTNITLKEKESKPIEEKKMENKIEEVEANESKPVLSDDEDEMKLKDKKSDKEKEKEKVEENKKIEKVEKKMEEKAEDNKKDIKEIGNVSIKPKQIVDDDKSESDENSASQSDEENSDLDKEINKKTETTEEKKPKEENEKKIITIKTQKNKELETKKSEESESSSSEEEEETKKVIEKKEDIPTLNEIMNQKETENNKNKENVAAPNFKFKEHKKDDETEDIHKAINLNEEINKTNNNRNDEDKKNESEEKGEDTNNLLHKDDKDLLHDLRLSTIVENEDEMLRSTIFLEKNYNTNNENITNSINTENNENTNNEKKESNELSDERKLEIVKSILGEDDEEREKKVKLIKRTSVEEIDLTALLKATMGKLDPKYKINKKKDIDFDEDEKEQKKDENKKEKKEEEKTNEESRPTLPKIQNREMKKNKTEGNLLKPVEDRKERLAKRLNRAKQVQKKNEAKNKYRKSFVITMQADILGEKLNLNELKENKKDK